MAWLSYYLDFLGIHCILSIMSFTTAFCDVLRVPSTLFSKIFC